MIFNKVGGGGEKVTINGNPATNRLNLEQVKILKVLENFPKHTAVAKHSDISRIKSCPFIYKNEIHAINQIYLTSASSADPPLRQSLKLKNDSWIVENEHSLTGRFLEVGNIDGNVYAVCSGENYTNVIVYKLNNNGMWEKISEYKNGYKNTYGTGVTDSYIYILNQNGNYMELVTYNLKEWTVKSVSPILTQNYGLSSTEFRKELHFVGSTNKDYARKHYKFNGHVWSKLSALPQLFHNCKIKANSEKLYAFGAHKDNTTFYDSFAYGETYIYDGAVWTIIPNSKVKGNAETGVIFINEKLLITGSTKLGNCFTEEDVYKEREV